MGHTEDVQLAWYRKHDSTIELTKVARALMSVDVGTRKDLQNKRIEDLDLGGHCIVNIANALDSLTQHASSDMCGYVEGISGGDVGKKRSWTSSD